MQCDSCCSASVTSAHDLPHTTSYKKATLLASLTAYLRKHCPRRPLQTKPAKATEFQAQQVRIVDSLHSKKLKFNTRDHKGIILTPPEWDKLFETLFVIPAGK